MTAATSGENAEVLTFNERNIAEFRANGGTLSAFGDAPVLLLTTTGARSGAKRVSPMMYRPHDSDPDTIFVFASNAGGPRHPAWYYNILAHPHDLVVEIGRDTLTAEARVLDSDDRDSVYRAQAEQFPGFADYETRTSRVIPVLALRLHRTTPIPPDDPARHGVHVNLESPDLQHISLVGDTYTVLVSGEDTAGAYTLIDMLVPEGGGPPPHRHDFEEMFAVLDGEIEVDLRGVTSTARKGDVINVPPTRRTGSSTAARSRPTCCACAPRPARSATSR
ncbi:nitroreductase/quinone reductase family protein [Pseudonocardia sp. MH-G8]|uniref:nitroreductase/quinone reductase family protein n=1 Tax=Pseudonocardia sp. MH-G8 TaxID=1854588 RepID=UPI0018E93ED8|nr:nitroreductase/quinone reductase family protein [Pseudonocardia sp. MH-G8]